MKDMAYFFYGYGLAILIGCTVHSLLVSGITGITCLLIGMYIHLRFKEE